MPAWLTPHILPLAVVPCILSSRVLDLAFTSLYVYLPSLFPPWVWFGMGERHRHAATASLFPSLEASWRFVGSISRTRSQHHVRIQYTMLRGVVVCSFLFFGSVLSLLSYFTSDSCAFQYMWTDKPTLEDPTSVVKMCESSGARSQNKRNLVPNNRHRHPTLYANFV